MGLFKDLHSLVEGGNISIDGDIDAEKINLNKIDRSKIVNMIKDGLINLNNQFKKKYKVPLWLDTRGIDTGTLFGGSSEHFMNQKISDKEFKSLKPKVGDIDVQVDKKLEDELKEFLKVGKSFKGIKYLGRGKVESFDEINTVFKTTVDKQDINFQIDFEFVEFAGDNQTDFSRFARSSAWADIKKGIKGAFHKFLLGSIDSAVTVDIPVVSRKTLKAKNVKAHAYAFSHIKGMRAKYEPATDKQGMPVIINGKKAYFELKASQTPSIKNLTTIYQILFGGNPNKSDIEKMKSFVGLTELINKHFTKPQKEQILNNYLEKNFGRGGKRMEKFDEDDYSLKMAGINQIFKAIPILKSKQKEIDKMINIYYKM